jgi:hypothetical protein
MDIKYLLFKCAEFHGAAINLPVFKSNPEVCGECGGKCCQNLPGAAHPEQFGAPDKNIMLNNIVKALKSGRWVLDYYTFGLDSSKIENIVDIKYMRPKTPDDRQFLSSNWPRGKCTFHTDKGCELTDEERPIECKTLEPGIKECKQHGKRKDIANEWKPYQDIVFKALTLARNN